MPAEKLKLSYWQNLPDSLIAEPKRGYWSYVLIAGVVALAGAALYFARRRKTEVTP